MILLFATVCQRSRAWKHRWVLPDGSYEALVVDAHADDDGTLHLEVTLTTGPLKGEVVQIKGTYPGRSEVDLLATPATLTVRNGTPRLLLET